VSGVKKICLWHVFSREVRSGCAARTNDASKALRHYPSFCANNNGIDRKVGAVIV